MPFLHNDFSRGRIAPDTPSINGFSKTIPDNACCRGGTGRELKLISALLVEATSGTFNAMSRFFLLLVFMGSALGQPVGSAVDLLQKAKNFGDSTTSWKAEVVETTDLTGPGMDMRSTVRTKIAAQPLLKMSRQNSGDDQTVMVCDGLETFYSGDGHSYYRNSAQATPQCNLPLINFYQPWSSTVTAEIVGEDRVLLANEERPCMKVRTSFKQGSANVVRTMCIDPARPVILRDAFEVTDEKSGIKSFRTITFVSFENKPVFSADAFRFKVPPGAVEAKSPQ